MTATSNKKLTIHEHLNDDDLTNIYATGLFLSVESPGEDIAYRDVKATEVDLVQEVATLLGVEVDDTRCFPLREAS